MRFHFALGFAALAGFAAPQASSPAGLPLQDLATLSKQRDWSALERAAAQWLEAGKGKAHEVLEYRAQARMNLGNLQGAATDLERAVELAPEDIAGWFNLGALRPAASAPRDKVASCLDRLVKIAPERALQFLAVPDVERVLLPSNPSDLGEVSFDRSKSPKPDRVPPYPPEARPRRIQGDVGVELILDQDGRPVRVRAVSGSAELRAAAEYCAVQLRYPPDLLGSKGRPVRLVQAIPFKLR